MATDNRRLMILGGIGAVLVVILLLFVVLRGGGGGDGESASSTTSIPSGTSTTTTTTAPGSPSVPGGSFDVFATKDPFQPVIDITSGGTSTGGTSGATTQTTPPAGGATTGGSATGGGTSSGASPTGSAGSQAPSAGTNVALLDVFQDGSVTKAQVRVGSTVYTVAAGETFATSYRAVSLSGTCGQFVFGDSPFQLCEGEEVIK